MKALETLELVGLSFAAKRRALRGKQRRTLSDDVKIVKANVKMHVNFLP